MKVAALAYLALVLVIGLLVALVMPGHSEEEEGNSEPAAAANAEIAPAEEIARRVAEIREREFTEAAPKLEVVADAELTKRLTQLDAKPQDPELVTAAALLMAQAGALPAEQAEQLAARRHGGTGVLGAYLPEERTVLLDRELAEEDPETAEAVAAGEMSRALDTAGSEAPRVPPLLRDDEAARVAVVGGAATQAAQQYARKHLGGEVDVEAAAAVRRDPETPPAVETLAQFPATVGAAFVRRAREEGGWKGVTEVLAEPPDTTAELLHAGAPEAVRSPRFAVRPDLRGRWKRLASADVGELDTIALLRAGNTNRVSFKAAAGWRSGRMETWLQGGPQQQCPPPCRKKSATVVVHRWGDPADAATFNRAMRDALTRGAQAEPEGGRGFTIEDGGAALVQAGRFTALVFAPDAPLAGRLAERALRG